MKQMHLVSVPPLVMSQLQLHTYDVVIEDVGLRMASEQLLWNCWCSHQVVI